MDFRYDIRVFRLKELEMTNLSVLDGWKTHPVGETL